MSLQKLLAPVSSAAFFEGYFETKPLLVARGRPDYYSGLLGLDDVDRIVTTEGVCYPDIRLVNAEREIESGAYTCLGDRIDPARLYQLHAGGATIILDHLHRSHSPLTDFCAALELEFSAPFQTNVYLTPPRAKGFKAHFDNHDVFVLQLHGTKHWRMYGTPIMLPLGGQSNDPSQGNPGVPTMECSLELGDSLYIPRGVVHDAVSGDEPSLHATVGVLAYTWTDLMLDALATMALRDFTFRRSLPPGFARPTFDRKDTHAVFKELLTRFSASADLNSALDTFVAEFINTRRPRLLGQLAQLRALQSLTMDSQVGCRLHLAYTLHEDESVIRIRCWGNEISMPREASTAVHYALTVPRFRVGDLPNEWDNDSKLVFVRRLIREGILMVATPLQE